MSLYDDILKLKEKRAKIVAEARADYDAAAKAGRSLEGERREKFDRAMEEEKALGEDIERLEKLDAAERRTLADPANTRVIPGGDGKPTEDPEKRAEREAAIYRKALRSMFGVADRANRDEVLSEKDWTELRALQADVDISGGFTNAPQQFIARLIKAVDDQVFIRQLATKFTVTSNEGMGVPTLDTDPADAAWTTELQTGDEDSSMAFGKRELKPNPLAKRIKMSRKLLRTSALPIDSIVIQRLSYKFAITEEKAFLTGSAAGQPLGLFTASADGVPTSRDVSTGNTTTSITFDGLKEAKWTLKSAYHGAARWLFHRDAGKQIDKLKDGNGQYIWQPSVLPGNPDQLLSFPVMFSEHVPNTFTTGLYVGMLADFSHYWIADALSLEIQRLNELYAETNQIGAIGRLETDGMPVLAEAFVRVTLT